VVSVKRIATATVFVILAVLPVPAAFARPGKSPDYLVAAHREQMAVGIFSSFTQVRVELCIPSSDLSEVPPGCIGSSPLATLIFGPVDAASVGSTIWIDSSSPGFDAFVSYITDGVNGPMGVAFLPAGTGGRGEIDLPGNQRGFFADQVGLGGNDLAGYAIGRIGLRVDAASFDTPGSNPNGDGNWTDFSFDGTFLFEGTVANSAACKNGGWQSLHGPSGTAFHNQGECLHLVKAGK
jgi:hypothetical protein